jgi:AcrR family transcriptional regulator
MEKDTDLRIVRTQQLIKAAFFELIDKIGFEKITVQNLTQNAAINRSTFYLHYADKYDLLNKLEEEVLEGLREILTAIDLDEIINFSYDEKPFPHIIRILEYVNAHEQFYKMILSANGDPSFINKIGDFIRFNMTEIIMKYGVLKMLKIPVNYVFSVFVAVITSFLNEWIRSGMKETPYELAGIMTLVIRDIPHKLVDFNV